VKSKNVFKVPVYGGKVVVFTDPEVFAEAVDSLEDLLQFKGLVELSTSGEGEEASIVYNIGVFSGGMTTFVHELFHTVVMIVGRAGFSVHDGNSEPAAYLFDSLFEKITKQFKFES